MLDPNQQFISKLEDKKFLANKANRGENTQKIVEKLEEIKPKDPIPFPDFPITDLSPVIEKLEEVAIRLDKEFPETDLAETNLLLKELLTEFKKPCQIELKLL